MEKFSVVLYTNNNITNQIFTASLFSILQQITPDQLIVVGHHYSEHPLLKNVKQVIYKNPVGKYNTDIYSQAIIGIEMSKYDTIFLAEHDVLYPTNYYADALENHKKGNVNYGTEIYMLNALGFWSYRPMRVQSMAFGTRKALLDAFHLKLSKINHLHTSADKDFDVGVTEGYYTPTFRNMNPAVDVRHTTNATATGTLRKAQKIIPMIPYWGKAKPLIERLELHYSHGIYHDENPPNE